MDRARMDSSRQDFDEALYSGLRRAAECFANGADPRRQQERLLRRSADLLRATWCGLWLREGPAPHLMRLAAAHGPSGHAELQSLPLGADIVGQCLRSRSPRVVGDCRDSALCPASFPAAKTLLAMPLLAGDRALGVLLAVGEEADRRFGQTDVEAVTPLVRQLAATVESAGLAAQLAALAERQRLLAKITAGAECCREADRLLEQLAERAVELGAADLCAVFTPDGEEVVLATLWRKVDGRVERAPEFPAKDQPQPGEGVVGKAMAGAPLLVGEGAEARALGDELATGDALGSAMVIPLHHSGPASAVLVLARVAGGEAFTEENLSLWQAIAARVSPALEVARQREHERDLRRERDEFVSIVSHDFKTPLTAIKGFAQLVARRLGPDANPALLGALETIDSQADSLAKLATDMVVYTRLESGQLPMEKRPVDLASLVATSVDLLAGAAERYSVIGDFPDDLPAVECDPARMQQAIANLLTVAMKRSPAGGEMRITIDRLDGMARLAIHDEGPALPAEERRRLHGRVSRADSGVALREGTGLAFAIARGIVEAHGGQLWVESRLGEGNTTYLTLPLFWRSQTNWWPAVLH